MSEKDEIRAERDEECAAVGVDDEAGGRMWDWMRTTYIEPELRRRLETGTMREGDVIRSAQVVFWVDRDEPVIRLNEEVKGTMLARATRAIEKDEEVTHADFDRISALRLPETEGDAAHVTMMTLKGGIGVVFDGSYNTLLIESQLEVADEFIELAAVALERELLRAFVENTFAAAELVARAELLSLPERRVVDTKSHDSLIGLYGQWVKHGNARPEFSRLLSRMHELRGAARYLRREFGLTPEPAKAALETLREMRAHVEEVRPKRELSAEVAPRSVSIPVPEGIRRGNLISARIFR
jgi:uncharacterized protein (UPF0332 family)